LNFNDFCHGSGRNFFDYLHDLFHLYDFLDWDDDFFFDDSINELFDYKFDGFFDLDNFDNLAIDKDFDWDFYCVNLCLILGSC
jgi:hypothetical protein